MAPKKGTKRAAVEAVPAPKKTKSTAAQAKADPAVTGVLDALALAEGLPTSVKQMLEASVPRGLCTPRDERNEVQESVVSMIGEVVESVRAKFQEVVETESGKVRDAEARLEELKAAVAAAEEASAAASTESSNKADALTEATAAALAAKGHLKDMTEAQVQGDADLVQAKENKGLLEQVLAENVAALVEGTSDDLACHFQALQPALEQLVLDESLMSALPSVCEKKAVERGTFDSMVLDQLAQTIRDRIATLATTVQEAQPAAEAREAAVREAQAKLDEATSAKEVATEALNVAEAARQAAEKGLKAAKEAVAEFEPQLAEAQRAHSEQVDKFADFKASSISGFETLRDRVTASDATVGGA